MKSLFFIAITLTTVGLVSLFFALRNKQPTKIQPTKPSIPLSYKNLTQESEWFNVEKQLTPEDLHGKLLLVDFWTLGCINCIHVMAELKAIEEKFSPEQLTVIGVHSGKFLSERVGQDIRASILRHNITHPVVNDKNFKIWKSFGVSAWPTLLLLNPEGKVIQTYRGEGNQEKIIKDIQDALESYTISKKQPIPIRLEVKKQETALSFPSKLAYSDNFEAKPALFVADTGNNRIVVCDLEGSVLHTIGSGSEGFSDGTFEQAQFSAPHGLAYNQADNKLYVADSKNHRVRVINFTEKTVSTLAGNGQRGKHQVSSQQNPLQTALSSPWDVCFYPSPAMLVIAMSGTHQLWLYEFSKNRLRILAGNGRESIDDGHIPYVSLSQPAGLAPLGSKLYFVDAESSALRVFEGNRVTTLIGTGLFDFGHRDGLKDEALMQHPQGLAADQETLYLADTYNHTIRRYNLASGRLSTINELRGKLNEPNDVKIAGDKLYIADTNNHMIIVFDLEAQKLKALSLQF